MNVDGRCSAESASNCIGALLRGKAIITWSDSTTIIAHEQLWRHIERSSCPLVQLATLRGSTKVNNSQTSAKCAPQTIHICTTAVLQQSHDGGATPPGCAGSSQSQSSATLATCCRHPCQSVCKGASAKNWRASHLHSRCPSCGTLQAPAGYHVPHVQPQPPPCAHSPAQAQLAVNDKHLNVVQITKIHRVTTGAAVQVRGLISTFMKCSKSPPEQSSVTIHTLSLSCRGHENLLKTYKQTSDCCCEPTAVQKPSQRQSEQQKHAYLKSVDKPHNLGSVLKLPEGVNLQAP